MACDSRGHQTSLLDTRQEASAEAAAGRVTWRWLALAWDGRPRISESTDNLPGGTVFTPHKGIHRITDHLVDHLAEMEALAGATRIPDTWHGRAVTLAADWASFTEADLNEARNRLSRLGQLYALRLRSLDDEALDSPRGQAWTIRQIVEHVAGVTWYAEQVGRL